jgi:hypothetical protein
VVAPKTNPKQAIFLYGTRAFLMRSRKLTELLIHRVEFHAQLALIGLWFALCTMAIGRDERFVFVLFTAFHAVVQSLDDASLREPGVSLFLSRLGFALVGFIMYMTIAVLFLLGTVPHQSYVRVEFRPDLEYNGTIDPDAAHVWDLTQSVADISLVLATVYFFKGFSVLHARLNDKVGEQLDKFSSINTPVLPLFERPNVMTSVAVTTKEGGL